MRQHLVGAGTNLTQKIKDLTLKIDMSECKDIKKSDRVNSAGRAAYVERNQWMIDESNIVVYYVKKSQGGVANALKYGKWKGVLIKRI